MGSSPHLHELDWSLKRDRPTPCPGDELQLSTTYEWPTSLCNHSSCMLGDMYYVALRHEDKGQDKAAGVGRAQASAAAAAASRKRVVATRPIAPLEDVWLVDHAWLFYPGMCASAPLRRSTPPYPAPPRLPAARHSLRQGSLSLVPRRRFRRLSRCRPGRVAACRGRRVARARGRHAGRRARRGSAGGAGRAEPRGGGAAAAARGVAPDALHRAGRAHTRVRQPLAHPVHTSSSRSCHAF